MNSDFVRIFRLLDGWGRTLCEARLSLLNDGTNMARSEEPFIRRDRAAVWSFREKHMRQFLFFGYLRKLTLQAVLQKAHVASASMYVAICSEFDSVRSVEVELKRRMYPFSGF